MMWEKDSQTLSIYVLNMELWISVYNVQYTLIIHLQVSLETNVLIFF